MVIPQSIKPLTLGAIGGAIVAMIIGFNWGGWVTGSGAQDMEEASAKAAVINALTPICVAKAEQEPDQLARLQAESDWKRSDFVIKTGWVDTVTEDLRRPVSDACASVVVEGMAKAGSSD